MKLKKVTIQIKATEQYFPVVLFMWMKSQSVTIQIKAFVMSRNLKCLYGLENFYGFDIYIKHT